MVRVGQQDDMKVVDNLPVSVCVCTPLIIRLEVDVLCVLFWDSVR